MSFKGANFIDGRGEILDDLLVVDSCNYHVHLVPVLPGLQGLNIYFSESFEIFVYPGVVSCALGIGCEVIQCLGDYNFSGFVFCGCENNRETKTNCQKDNHTECILSIIVNIM